MGMQLNENYTDIFGNKYTQFYLKIVSLSPNYMTGEIFIHLGYFKDQVASDNNFNSLKQYTNSFIPTNPNGDLRAQSYTYLKTLPEFIGVTDVF